MPPSRQSDAADEEVDRVMAELNADVMKGVTSVPSIKPVTEQAAEQQGDEEDEEDMAAMRERLAQLKATPVA